MGKERGEGREVSSFCPSEALHFSVKLTMSGNKLSQKSKPFEIHFENQFSAQKSCVKIMLFYKAESHKEVLKRLERSLKGKAETDLASVFTSLVPPNSDHVIIHLGARLQ